MTFIWHASILKWIRILQFQLIAQGVQFSNTKDRNEIRTRLLPTRVPNAGGVRTVNPATFDEYLAVIQQEGLAVASIAQDVVVEMTPPHDHNAR